MPCYNSQLLFCCGNAVLSHRITFVVRLFVLIDLVLLLLVQSGDGDDIIQSDYDSDRDQNDQEKNPLMVPLDEEVATQEEITNKWFSQDIFAEAVEQGDLEDDSDHEMQIDRQEEKLSVPKKPKEKAANHTAGFEHPKKKSF